MTVARLWGSIILLVVAFDTLLYREEPGVSVAVYGILLIATLVWNRPGMKWDLTRCFAVGVIVSSLGQSAVEINFCNAVILLTCFSVAMVEYFADELGCRSAVAVLAALAWLRALGRWACFLRFSSASDPKTKAREPTSITPWRLARIVVPALIVVAPLALLMGFGNALLGRSLTTAIDTLGSWLQLLDFPRADRIILWCLCATGALSFLWPAIDRRAGSFCTRKWPTFALQVDEALSRWRTWVVLGLANVLFFWANGLDVWFLWHEAKLPAGVSYSEFVHQGVYALIGTTLLSALMLTVLFQQHESVSRRALTRSLALAWIVQNLFLIGSVCLRLKLYVEAYQFSVLRFHVGSFLVLIVAGYALLSWRIIFEKSLNWLLAANSLAVFLLFYALQFIDVPGIVARYNVEHWLEVKTESIDVAYLKSLGVSALPSLVQVQRWSPDSRVGFDARNALLSAEKKRKAASGASWKSWQWREHRILNEVFPISHETTTPIK